MTLKDGSGDNLTDEQAENYVAGLIKLATLYDKTASKGASELRDRAFKLKEKAREIKSGRNL